MSKYNICVECNKEFGGRKKKYCSKECSDEVRRRKNRERMRKVNPPKPDVTIICEWCGELHTVPSRTAHQARFCSDDCRYTWRSRVVYGHKPIEERNAERRKQKLIRQKRLEKERAIRTLRNSLIRVIKHKEEQERIKELTRECEECGTMFYDPHPRTLTCSSECSRKRNNRVSRMYRNSRYNEHNLIDKDITLTKLYERDKGICYLCGKPCDYDDITITEEGHYIVGRNYPSIDHVLAIANGGHHSWSNVKLSHHYCNTIKRDNLIENKHDKAPV